MLTFDVDYLGSQQDLERRRSLRSFLMQCRSRFEPNALGLPLTARRRVSGLRRGEVAELIGVTVDWYRSFESGRPVRVSPQFLSRLVNVFKLGHSEALILFSLAIPEVYAAAVAANAFIDPLS
jgi:Helix-turn-helix domain